MNTSRTAAVLMLALLVPSAPGFAGIEECQAAFDTEDWSLALSECRPLAEQGHPDAQLKLGSMYREEKGVPRRIGSINRVLILAAVQCPANNAPARPAARLYDARPDPRVKA